MEKKPLTVGSLIAKDGKQHAGREMQPLELEKKRGQAELGYGEKTVVDQTGTKKSPVTSKASSTSKNTASVPSVIRLTQNRKAYTIRAVSKQRLLDAALAQGQSLQYKCRKGTCGMCTVHVTEGAPLLHEANSAEMDKLGGNIQNGYRLACQAVMK
ncbi:2Fe-2S iron-sulfur cluster-binding protein [Brevibacillus dissolubilis]|uniref:2Fe-2S iron-sulfur cluster-binding protein n=1 Tax=Brevibacillus dissolubilis TaxID=1844116 RepID=UPI00159BD022|nr:2Fe-2S iron-sulfur cluster binding domain-containing protein [Brevibacillus dissolubilis]